MNFVTVFFDDSGTVEQWAEFVRNWIKARQDLHFDVFHMVDFAAGHKEFAGWSDAKKRSALRRLCNIINTRVKVGYAVAVPKRIYDAVIQEPFRAFCGQFHYTFAVRQGATRIGEWRRKHHKSASMKYIFDRMGSNQGKGEIMTVMDAAISKSEKEGKSTGVPPLTGYSFESKTSILPLQAADILAWTILQQMHKRLSERKLNWVAELAWEQLASFAGTLEASFFTSPA